MAFLSIRKPWLLATTALAAAATLSDVATAQERIRERLDTDRVLGTVEVTTQKRTQDLQDVPISVQAFDAELLETLRIDGFDDLATFTPGLIASPNPAESSGLRLAIRGIGVNDPQIGLDATVGLYVNGIYVGKTPGLAFDTPDLESVEVVKGPQGTLFGRNAVAGAISINTKGAEIGEWTGHATTEFGNFDSFGYRGAVNIPIGDTAAIKIAGLSFERDGYVENVPTNVDLGPIFIRQGLGNDFGGVDRSGLTVDLAWEPLPNLRLEYGFEDTRTDAEPFFTQATAPFGTLLAPTLGLPTPPLVPIADDGRQDEAVSTVPIGISETDIIGHRFEANYDWNEDHSTKFLFGYRRADSNAFASFFPELNPFVLDATLLTPTPLPDGSAGPSLLDTFNSLPAILAGVGIGTRPDFGAPLAASFNPPLINGPFSTFGTTSPQGNPVLDNHEQFSFELTQTGNIGDRITYTVGGFYFDEDTAAGPFLDAPGEAVSLAQLFPALGFLEPIGDVSTGLATVGAALANPLTPVDQLPGLQAQLVDLQAQLAELTGTTGLAGVLQVARAPGARIDLETQAFAFYGDVTFALTDKISLTGGLRYSRDDKSAVQQGLSPFFNDTTDLLGNPIEPLIGDETFDSVDPRVVIEYTPTDNLLVYASYSQAFRSGGFNQAAVGLDDFNFDEERIRATELGVKSDFFNGRIRLNGAFFASFLDDQQFSFTNPVQPVTRFIDNNDSQRIGFELDGQFVVGDFLTASASYTFLDADADEFFNPFTGEDISDVDQAPRNSYSINLDYVRPIAVGEFHAHLGFNHKDSSTITSTQLTDQNLLDARVSYTIAGEGNRAVTIFAYGQNLTDDEFTIDALDVFSPILSNLETFGLPRTYGGGITVSF
ncbi:MAG: TonB-dependent receptor [Pseudomonadota bacterium]